MADEDEVVAKKKRTLLEKYDIPIAHLTYEYVEKCNDGKELERIVKILRSGEEGIYPQLVQSAEARLTTIMPGSKVLQVEEPVLTKSMLEPGQWNQVNNELKEWSGEMKSLEQQLLDKTGEFPSGDLPGIRRGKVKDRLSSVENADKGEEVKKLKSVVPRDYSAWEKFDADKELLKMDIEEERRNEEIERKERLRLKELEAKKKDQPRSKVVDGAGDFSTPEKVFLASQEKDRGNEYFKAGEFHKAIEHYSASITLDPLPVTYNNRAMANLKVHRYVEALVDCNKVLAHEPDNCKALMRRGISHQNRSNFQKALEDFSRVVLLEPDNRLARSLSLQMEEKCTMRAKSVRMKITDEDSSVQQNAKIVELEDYVEEPCEVDPDKTENGSWPTMPKDRRVRYNEFGFARVVCNCSGVPNWVRKPPPKCLVCKEIREKRKAAALVEKESSEESSRVTGSDSSASVCSSSESDEECLCNDTDKSAGESRTEMDLSEAAVGNVNNIVTNQGSEIKFETHSLNSEQDLGARKRDIVDTDQEKGSGDSRSKEKGSFVKKKDTPLKEDDKKVQDPRTPRPPVRSQQEVKTPKVQVASKYTQGISKGEEIPVHELVGSTHSGPVPQVEAISGLTLEDSAAAAAPRITSPYEFITSWQSIKPSSDPSQYAAVLRRVDPANLSSLIGNKLDGTMLSTIVHCLEASFMPDSALVLDYLQQLTVLPRFSFVKLFLSSSDKLVIERLFEYLENVGCHSPADLRQAYGV